MNSDEINKDTVDEDTLPVVVKSVGLRYAYIICMPESLVALDLFVGDEIVFHGEFNVEETHEIIKLADDFLYYRNEWKLH
jgi:hypothetical protein